MTEGLRHFRWVDVQGMCPHYGCPQGCPVNSTGNPESVNCVRCKKSGLFRREVLKTRGLASAVRAMLTSPGDFTVEDDGPARLVLTTPNGSSISVRVTEVDIK